MEKTKIQKISQLITRLPGVRSIGIIGDPGCDGLGTYNMKVYAGVLEKSAKDDITMVVGDLVPEGTNTYYNTICSLTETVAENDVYVLRGNHDTGTYKDFFGLQNYALLLEDYAVIVLDNALRTFEEEGLQLLSRVLEMEEVKQAVVFFHIPVPNHFILNCVSEEEFERLEDEGDDKGGNDGVFKVDASVGEKFEDDCTKCSKYENFSNYLPNKRTNDEVFGEELGGLVDRKREDDGA